ncbi:hypothetical protein F5Y02DRAFT_319440 [Annulohypoxylon stygium]|nr:hypothetical protein F5Y02DRAFT_319440 [Annulohypoxylon stygium]
MDSYRPEYSTSAAKPGESRFPVDIQLIFHLIDGFTEETLDLLDPDDHHKGSSTPTSAISPSQLLETFKDAMTTIQRKTSKALHEVETKLGPNSQFGSSHEIANAPLEDLAGVNVESEANRMLGQVRSGGKPSYKLRNHLASDPSPRLIVDNDATAPQATNPEDIFVVLQPTLRNVWVVQHAYARLQNHKEQLIKEYIASVDPGTALSRKFAREYYEDLGLANLPSKNKLGNLLDVKCSSHNQETHDMMIVLRVQNPDGSARNVEVVTEADVNPTGEVDGGPYVVFPVAEASIKMLYDTYKALRKATSEQRRAARDKEFAASLPVDAMDELEKQFNIGSSEKPDQADGNHSKKRRRMLDDE